jgi:hypothetical protein
MKLTKNRLKQIIREELAQEGFFDKFFGKKKKKDKEDSTDDKNDDDIKPFKYPKKQYGPTKDTKLVKQNLYDMFLKDVRSFGLNGEDKLQERFNSIVGYYLTGMEDKGKVTKAEVRLNKDDGWDFLLKFENEPNKFVEFGTIDNPNNRYERDRRREPKMRAGYSRRGAAVE